MDKLIRVIYFTYDINILIIIGNITKTSSTIKVSHAVHLLNFNYAFLQDI